MNWDHARCGLTCEVLEAELTETEVAVSAVVEEDSQRVAVFVQPGAANDAQILQGQVFKLIQRHEHVSGHFTNGLQTGQSKAINQTAQRCFQCFRYIYLKVKPVISVPLVANKITKILTFPKHYHNLPLCR